MGAALSTVYYNMRLRHPTLDMPLIDYDLALLFQPMLMLGISIGVVCNVMFADWMVTVLLIILFIGNINVEIPVFDDYQLVRPPNLILTIFFYEKRTACNQHFLKL
jgi:hypothetical protein